MLNMLYKSIFSNDILNPFTSVIDVASYKGICKESNLPKSISEECRKAICFIAFEIKTLETFIQQPDNNNEFTLTYTQKDLNSAVESIEKEVTKCGNKN